MINIDHLATGKGNNPQLDEAVSAGIRHIGIAVYSSGKIYEYLVRKGFEPSIAHTAVKELIQREYIDDMRAGRKVVASRTGRKQESRALLYKRLLQAGIAEDKADALIHRTRDDKETCTDLIKAAFPVNPDEDTISSPSFIDDVLKLCVRRGYSPNTVRYAVKQYLEYLL